ncbi:hypothetical protein C0992_000103 [Termitomyces sp. T32_za158]|nr:hypothetical protein C0992_000103 [Termitomyces sp. T32_za158]
MSDPFIPYNSAGLGALAPVDPASWSTPSGPPPRSGFFPHDSPLHMLHFPPDSSNTLVSQPSAHPLKLPVRNRPHTSSSLANSFVPGHQATPSPASSSPRSSSTHTLHVPTPLHPPGLQSSRPLPSRPGSTTLASHSPPSAPHLSSPVFPTSPVDTACFTPPSSVLFTSLVFSRPPSVFWSATSLAPVPHPFPLVAPFPPPHSHFGHYPQAPALPPFPGYPPYHFPWYPYPLAPPANPPPSLPPPAPADAPPAVPSFSSDPVPNAKLPPLSTIPCFNSSADWGLWINPVLALIDDMGLNGRVCPIPPPGAPFDPTCRVVVAPNPPPHSSRAALRDYEIFWRNDNVCSYIISGKLSAEIFNLLPPARGGPHNFPVRTARDLLDFLLQRFSVGSAASAQCVKDSVFALHCAPNAIPAYVQAWHIAVNQLSGTPWDFMAYEKVQRFMDGILDHCAFTFLWEEVRRSWDNNPSGSFDFFCLADTILETDIDVRRRLAVISNHSAPRTANPSSSTCSVSSAHLNPFSSSSAAPSTSGDPPNVCRPHGLDPPKDKDAVSRPRAHVVVAPPVTEPIASPGVFIFNDGLPSADLPAPGGGNDNDTPFCLYDLSEESFVPLPPAFAGMLSPFVLASFSPRYNAVLDSGCTMHIIRD